MVDVKPSCSVWMGWAQVVIDQFTTAVDVYTKPPYLDDSDLASHEQRQKKATRLVDILRRLHVFRDEYEDLAGRGHQEVERASDRLVESLRPLLQDVLGRLPELSRDMQKLLHSGWHSNCNGRTAQILFCGPRGREEEGIGSGFPEHGRLPQSLVDLFDQEQMGDVRGAGDVRAPQTSSRTEALSRWRSQGLRSLSGAGRID